MLNQWNRSCDAYFSYSEECVKTFPETANNEFSQQQKWQCWVQIIIIKSQKCCSAESGIPTFRGAGGLWRKYKATELATLDAFNTNPSLVWEFYSYRREVVLTKRPNDAHHAIAEFEKRMVKEGREVHVITQNVDGLHQTAGSKNVIELHGIHTFW